jgi:hypothetical protein
MEEEMNKKSFIAIIILCYWWSYTAFAFDNTITHPDITKAAIGESKLDIYLKNNLELIDGIKKLYNGKAIEKLIWEGSDHEDSAFRGFNHFYNPLTNTGMNDYIFSETYISSIMTPRPTRAWAMGKMEDGTSLDECLEGDHSSDSRCNDY